MKTQALSSTVGFGSKSDSVVNGGAMIILARFVGMGCAFLLFVMLARQSQIEAGVFRLVVSYLLISEMMGLLGTQRWLVVAIGQEVSHRGQLFLAGSALALLTAVLFVFTYLGISISGLYDAEISDGLQLAALAAVPAALLTNVQTMLLAVGMSKCMGQLNLGENVVRSVIGMICVWAGLGALSVLLVFVAIRWLTTLFGLIIVVRRLGPFDWLPQRKFLRRLVRQVPRFCLIMLAFLVIRNAALLLLPILVDVREAAVYAVSYQFYDIALLVPTILALSSNFLFVNRAARGSRSLRWAVCQLWALTSVFLLPVVMLALVFGSDLLLAVFGQSYAVSIPAFHWLMLAVLLAALDQVLSQTMLATRRFREDTISTLSCAGVAVMGTIVLGEAWGATGAAMAYLMTMICILTMRFAMLRSFISAKIMFKLILTPLLLVAMMGVLFWAARYGVMQIAPVWLSWIWLPASLFAISVYWYALVSNGGLGRSKLWRMRKFLSIRHESKQMVMDEL